MASEEPTPMGACVVVTLAGGVLLASSGWSQGCCSTPPTQSLDGPLRGCQQAWRETPV